MTLDLFSERFTPNELIARLRKGAPPVIGYIARDLAKLDLRTIFPAQDEQVVEAIRAIFR